MDNYDIGKKKKKQTANNIYFPIHAIPVILKLASRRIKTIASHDNTLAKRFGELEKFLKNRNIHTRLFKWANKRPWILIVKH